jgi:hypothetical protein
MTNSTTVWADVLTIDANSKRIFACLGSACCQVYAENHALAKRNKAQWLYVEALSGYPSWKEQNHMVSPEDWRILLDHVDDLAEKNRQAFLEQEMQSKAYFDREAIECSESWE